MTRTTFARLAACLALSLFACGGQPPPQSIYPVPRGEAQYPSPGGNLREEARALLSRAIQVDTTNPPGNEEALAELLVDSLRGDGVSARVVDVPGEGRAAAWASVPGSGEAAPIVLLSHLDVVPAEPEEWAVAPFAGVSGGGYVVGRGALDAKGVAVVHLLTLKELVRRGIGLKRDVILLATPDEETGGEGGAGWIVRQRRELLGGAELLLTEGGGILPGEYAGQDIWGVSFVEKAPCWLELSSRGLGGHGSVPPPNSATRRLVRALARSEEMVTELRVVPEVAHMFALLAPLAAPGDRERFLQLRGALTLNPEFRERFMADPGRAALVRNTVALTMLQGSARSNVVPAEARATLDVRLLPGERCETFAENLRGVIADPEVEIAIRLPFESLASPSETPLMRAIARVAERADPPGLAIPRVITGFTDAHWFREVGITAYGFIPRRLRPIETRTIHGPNERVSVDNLELGVETLLAILQQLDTEE